MKSGCRVNMLHCRGAKTNTREQHGYQRAVDKHRGATTSGRRYTKQDLVFAILAHTEGWRKAPRASLIRGKGVGGFGLSRAPESTNECAMIHKTGVLSICYSRQTQGWRKPRQTYAGGAWAGSAQFFSSPRKCRGRTRDPPRRPCPALHGT